MVVVVVVVVVRGWVGWTKDEGRGEGKLWVDGWMGDGGGGGRCRAS